MSNIPELICFVGNEKQLAAFRNSTYYSWKPRVATPDKRVMETCRAAEIESIDLWRYVDYAQQQSRYLLACDVARSLAAVCKPHVDKELWEVLTETPSDYAYTLYAILNWSHAVRRVLSEHRPAALAAFAECSEIFGWSPMDLNPDVSNAVVRIVADQNRVPCTLLECGARPGTWLDKEQASIRPGWEWNPAEIAISTSADIVVWAGALGYRELELFLEALEDRKSSSLLFTDGAAGACIPKCDMGLFSRLPWRRPVDRGGQVRMTEEFKDALCRALPCRLGEFLSDDRFGMFWRMLERQAGYLVRSRAQAEFVRKALNPSVVVAGWDLPGATACLTNRLREQSIPVVSFEHMIMGTPDFKHLYGKKGNHVAVGGCVDADYQQNIRISPRHVRIVGKLDRQWTSPANGGRTPAALQPDRVCIATSLLRRGELLHGNVDPLAIDQSWELLAALCRKLSGTPFEIWHHPRYDDNLDQVGALAAQAGNVHVPVRGTARDWGRCLVLVLMNTPSTLTLEAIHHGVPVLYLKDLEVLPLWCSPIEKGIPVLKSVGELENWIGKLVGDPRAREELILAQRQFLQSFLAATGGEAVRLMRDYVRDVMADPSRAPTPDMESAREGLAERWILNLTKIVSYIIHSRPAAGQVRAALKDLARHSRGLRPDDVETLEATRLGEFFVGAVLDEWTAERGGALTSIVVGMLRALPRGLRPPLGVMTRALRRAMANDIRVVCRTGTAKGASPPA